MKNIVYVAIVAVSAYFMGCIEPYDPPSISEFDDLLVIDANVNGSTGEANVYLSRSLALDDDTTVTYVSGAFVQIEVENGATFTLDEIEMGRYYVDGIELNYGDMARVRVVVNDVTEYLSNFEEYIETPPIDSITFDSDSEVVNFYVTTHDPDNNTFYYKWDFTETWEFRSAFVTGYYYEKIDTNVVVYQRERPDTLHYCYKYDSSTQIIIGNSKRLSEDIINAFKIASIDNSTGKFAQRYSMLVKQRALTEESYKYWELLQSNTENIGSIFDPQPTQIISNIYNSANPNEIVLGYFNLYSETKERIELGISDVAPHYYNDGYNNCAFDTILVEDMYDDLTIQYLLSGLFAGPAPYAYIVGYPSCVDCRLRGTNKVPEIWQ